MGHLTVVVTSPRVAPGLLSAAAWQVLLDADAVYVRTPVHPQTPYLEAAQIQITALDGTTEQTLTDQTLATELIAAARHATIAFLADEHSQVGLAQELANQLAWQSSEASPVAYAGPSVELEVLSASWDLPGARLLDVVQVMDRLRSPGGCAWDAQQTHQSLVTYLLEETYEVIEAIESGSRTDLCEELGDLLLQVIFHARLEEEDAQQPWSIDEVSRGICEKLRRRHPHVFGAGASAAHEHELAGVDPSTPDGLDQYESTWQQMKTDEKSRESVLDGVAQAQPALSLASKMLSRVNRGGLSVPLPAIVPSDEPDHRLGVQILHLVEQARQLGVDPEASLRQVLRHYADNVRQAESLHPASSAVVGEP